VFAYYLSAIITFPTFTIQSPLHVGYCITDKEGKYYETKNEVNNVLCTNSVCCPPVNLRQLNFYGNVLVPSTSYLHQPQVTILYVALFPDMSSFWDIKYMSRQIFWRAKLAGFLAIDTATKKKNNNNSSQNSVLSWLLN